ncbi:septal ring factor EnvC (AmiA/AmiB activator) [Sphingomonas jinjuensis]|uniref:Septal ring factor EnvC (AmiA/AmiB activator) n=1 Tax=Sphingomonas jinjuensis TaxID=535907 RepID=A0A840F9X6_9SPHN|nr:peptidoglycan DD-metalloendopeptidase family protein [Sphingomonas jinjuensis]MBB4154810.1 septal ring factor EnvC (AmiA/AmiB activator) [Sphingomonas jinjuensis]
MTAVAGLVLLLTPAASQTRVADQRARLATARRDAAAATRRAEMLVAAAARERDAAEKARADERALAARVDAAAADLAAAEARSRLIDRLLADRRARLAEQQAPVARLLAAMQAMARRPAVVALAQPGSVDDLVRIRAVLGSALPAVRTRSAAVRRDLDATRRLQSASIQATAALRDGRARLESSRVALATLEADHRRRSASFGRDAMSEEDRALALGEQARDLVDRLGEEGQAATTAAALVDLPGPPPRPLAPGTVPPRRPRGIYRAPVKGRVVTGFGEISDAGVRSRGLAFAVAPGAPIVAPAGGRVRYVAPFRGYGIIVVIDHQDGWTSLVTGLGRPAVRPGDSVALGTPLGRATTGDDPRVTVELRRRRRPVDAAALIG